MYGYARHKEPFIKQQCCNLLLALHSFEQLVIIIRGYKLLLLHFSHSGNNETLLLSYRSLTFFSPKGSPVKDMVIVSVFNRLYCCISNFSAVIGLIFFQVDQRTYADSKEVDCTHKKKQNI